MSTRNCKFYLDSNFQEVVGRPKMKLISRSTLYLLIACCIWHGALCRPVYIDEQGEIHAAQYRQALRAPKDQRRRQQRQVVQPKWLTGPDAPNLFPVDDKVHVTKQSLEEAAAIRKAIQQAVDEGRFAVEAGQSESPSPAAPSNSPSDSNGNVNPTLLPFGQSFFGTQDASNWFQWPTPDSIPSMPSWLEPLQQQTADSNFMKEIQRMWTDLLENTRRMFSGE